MLSSLLKNLAFLFEQQCVKAGQNWPMFSRWGVFRK